MWLLCSLYGYYEHCLCGCYVVYMDTMDIVYVTAM